ncbi:MAG: excinuclease ABC subunit UvrC [Sulfurovaceae bacterium]|nr:excinuclease ABC subunit UvrC [Sulfurovaceae bacterium]
MQSVIRTLPHNAGIYQYFDRHGKLLYVGKAKNLKNRVKSYWRFSPKLMPNPALSHRLIKMLSEVVSLEYIIVESEEDALILENSLIKQLKPKYNILLRDDKTYPYICIDESDKFPRFEITRKIIKGKNITYYGPFPSGAKVLLDALYEVYPIVQKKSCIKGKKACLFHQIGKCLAPCENKITTQDYAKIVKDAKESITKRQNLIEALSDRMMLLASQERYEEAAKLRDAQQTISSLTLFSNLDTASLENCDAIAIFASHDRGVILKLFIRDGKVISSDHSFFRFNEFYDSSEAYTQAIISAYQPYTPDVQGSIIVAHPFEGMDEIALLLSKKLNKKIIITNPQRGYKARIIELALANAKELLSQKSRLQDNNIESKLATIFELQELPYRIEVFDNSHHQGEASVGAMIVWDEGDWDKNSYRRYILESKDEYGQMRELLSRRISDFGENPPPNLWVLDGGAAQLNLAKELLKNARVNIDVIAIAKEKIDAKAHRAKGAAKDTIYTVDDKFSLLSTDERLHFVQRLRDEAHRYAISFHRQKKRKIMIQSQLLEKKGIGKATLAKLLNHFGSFEAIHNASFEDIAAITNKKIASAIKEEA